ncbi:multicopper oxidase family protein [Streptomyces capillispiralis]|uniref:Multicopper oxidase CueO n=1 Tax=Streptomyces capillispiralis TaxID=68182 RepID=A0A561TC99_9ACTN|nr:multicopper oxidase domain-containing protein [Streptomyces capillispiralis]TWF84740.1 secreted protein [Streptomyces capillispiralis]GHH95792.1 spore coat protein A [Streptomyces capillispiralis]
MITRRTFLVAGATVTGALGGAGLLLPPSGQEAAAADLDPAGIRKFTLRMPVPPVLRPYAVSGTTRYYAMPIKEVNKTVVPGRTTAVRTFNGSFPGPVIKARSGERVVVRQTNQLSVPTSVHLHGAHVPEDSDGGPMDLIAPNGGRKTYTYPNTQPHANLWFHDHAHHAESENVFRGLTGTYLLTDDTEERLGLPSGAYDVPVSLRDARFDDSGALVYEMGDFLHRNVILANGKAWPYFEVAARKYRFRVYNTANMRYFDLSLSDGSEFQLIGTDGGLLPAPYRTTSVALSPGERADIVVDFSRYPVGTELVLANRPDAVPGGPADLVSQVLQFRVTRTAADSSVVPGVLRTLPELPPATVDRSVELFMDETSGPHGLAYIDGKVYDHDRIDTEIAYGTTEIWTVTNANQIAPHNFHMHLVQFRVLERNGQPVTSGPEYGLKDTVSLMPGETVRLQATFTGYRGTYVYHCHIFDHAAMGMMANMRIV